MLATLNRFIGNGLIAIGVLLAAFGVYFGGFAWLNSGAKAGIVLLGTAGAFSVGFALAGFAFRFAAAAHARRAPRRWWIQVAAVLAAYVAFGLAAEATSLLDRLSR